MHTTDDEVNATKAAAQERAGSNGSVSAPKAEQAAPGSAAAMLHLQRAIGNAGVAQLMRNDEDRESVSRATSSGGQSLDPRVRVQMERSIGADFSSVRVHTGGEADSSARQLGAHAYTVGDDIVFANGRYETESVVGQRTLAHELTHVVQQRSGPVSGTETGGGVKVSHPSDPFEQAAEANAERVVASRAVDPTAVSAPTATAGPPVQRESATGEEAEAVQALHVQREATQEEEPAEEEPEPVQALAVQREATPEEEPAEEEPEPVQTLAVQRDDDETEAEE